MNPATITLPADLSSVLNNSAAHQDACRYALDQFIIFTQGLDNIQTALLISLAGIACMYAVLLFKMHRIEMRVKELVHDETSPDPDEELPNK